MPPRRTHPTLSKFYPLKRCSIVLQVFVRYVNVCDWVLRRSTMRRFNLTYRSLS